MSKPKVIRLSVDMDNPLHERVGSWLSQFERKHGRRSRRSSYHFLAAMMLYIDVREGRARVIPAGGGPSTEEVISRVMFGDDTLAREMASLVTGESPASPGVVVPAFKAEDRPDVHDEAARAGVAAEPVVVAPVSPAVTPVASRGSAPVLKRSLIGDVGFGGSDDF